jgi:hypothetical protein
MPRSRPDTTWTCAAQLTGGGEKDDVRVQNVLTQVKRAGKRIMPFAVVLGR